MSLPSGDLRLQALNPATPWTNACDPNAYAEFVDDAGGLDADIEGDSGLVVTEAGLSLSGTIPSVPECTAIQVLPNAAPAKDLLVTSMAPSPNSVQYAASVIPPSCYPSGTPPFLWSIDKYDIAQISTTGQLTLATPIAGPITVTAYAGNLSASVVCNVTVNVVDTTSAPVGYSNAQFPATTGAADSIQIIYPYPGTVFPLGLPSPLVQWQNNNSPATPASAVKVTLRFPTTGTPIFSWAEIVPELQSAPTPSLPAQPRATIPQSVWDSFQQSVVRNSGALGGDAIIAVQRYVGSLQGEVTTTIHFANGQLKGNIFYNSYGTNLVQNFASTKNGQPFGAATLEVPVNGTSPTVVVGYDDPTHSGAGCRVCHTVAAGGTTLLSNSYLEFGNSGGGDEATTYSYNATLGSPTAIQNSEALVGTAGTNLFTFAALSPDGTYLLNDAAPFSTGSVANLYTLAGAPITSNLPSTLKVSTPTFSPDAAQVAFNFYGGNAQPLANANADAKSIAVMDFAAPDTFSNFRVLYTPPSGVAYSVWPSYLPPGQGGIVFQNEIQTNGRTGSYGWGETRSTCDGTGTCNDIGATGNLWWVSTGANPQAAPLTNLNGGAYLPRLTGNDSSGHPYYHGTSADNSTYYEEVYNYEPTVLPITIGGYSWVAFTSRRMYGNVATINPYWSDPRYQDISVQPTTKKIWIAAIASNPTPGTDPSFPAFYLPGQELLAGNARAYFALAACENAGTPSAANVCTSNLDCCGGTASPPTAICKLDPPPLANPPVSHCVAASASACVADGAACTSDAECCNFASGSRCGSGTCQPAPSLAVYAQATFTTEYQGSCPLGYAPQWNTLRWNTWTPSGTSIVFTAQTSPDGTTWGAPVLVGTAAPPPSDGPSGWTQSAQWVDTDLAASGQKSQLFLKVAATLNPDPTATVAPTLIDWDVRYDCAPSE
jgi:hypothetical protein